MGGIFLNYRRHPERQELVRTLRDQLVERFGEGQVFLDEPSIDPGEDYREVLRQRLLDAEVVIAVIHPDWLADLRWTGSDWVRDELELALDNDKTILPVLLDEAEMPKAAALSESLHRIAYRQAHPLRGRSWASDLRSLVDKLDLLVTPEWEPGAPETVAPAPQRRWIRYLAAVLGLGALLAPLPLLPAASGAREVAVVGALLALVSLLAPLLASLVVFLGRKPINVIEHSVQDMPLRAYYLRVAAPNAVVFLLLFGSPFVTGPPPRALVPVLVVAGFLLTLYLVVLVRRQQRDEQRRETEWPQRMPEPVRAAPARQELARLERRVTGWPAYRASRELCARADWHVRHLRSAGAALRADARRGRWRWFSTDHPVLLCGYATWIPGSVGVLLAAALPRLALWVPVFAAVFAGAVAAGTMEFAYRRQRWTRTEVAREIEEHTLAIEAKTRELAARRG